MAEIVTLRRHEEERFRIENALVSTGGEISEATQTPVTPEGVAELERLFDAGSGTQRRAGVGLPQRPSFRRGRCDPQCTGRGHSGNSARVGGRRAPQS